MKTYRYIVILLLSVMVYGCKQSQDAEPYPVLRVDKVLAGVADADSARYVAAIDSVRPEINAMMSVLGYPSPDWQMLTAWSESAVVRVFQPDVDSVYANVDGLEREIGHIMREAARQGIALPHMHFAAVVWGSQRPIVRVDSIVLIALNHYLGAQYPGYEGFNALKRSEKIPDMLPYDLSAVLCATQYPMSTKSAPTLLSWMLYEGALAYGRMLLVPDASEARALGFTDEQLRLLTDNEKALWQEMALKKLFYETDPMVIDRYLTAAPNTPLLQGQAPGRVGRYIGYIIVKSYLKKHKDATLQFLLSPSFYDNPSILSDISI